jgi:hypothetical protein
MLATLLVAFERIGTAAAIGALGLWIMSHAA